MIPLYLPIDGFPITACMRHPNTVRWQVEIALEHIRGLQRQIGGAEDHLPDIVQAVLEVMF